MSTASPVISFTTAQLAEEVRGDLCGSPDVRIDGIEAIDCAGARQITFLADEPHARRWGASQAAAAVVDRQLELTDVERPLIVVDNAELATARLLALFAPEPGRPDVGVHPSAFVHEGATIGADVRIGPHVSVDRNANIGDGSVLHAGVRIGADVIIGPRSVLYPNVTVGERCRMGEDVTLHPGVVIGSEGFGYRPDPELKRLVKIPQIGDVRIGDRVEIGANTCVDRAKFGSTTIGNDTKLDNLVQIAHNCRIGENVVMAGHSGLSGSVTIGNGVQIGGAASISDHVTVGDGARIAGKSGVMRDVKPGQTVFGYPADDRRFALRQVAALRKLPDVIRRLSKETGSR